MEPAPSIAPIASRISEDVSQSSHASCDIDANFTCQNPNQALASTVNRNSEELTRITLCASLESARVLNRFYATKYSRAYPLDFPTNDTRAVCRPVYDHEIRKTFSTMRRVTELASIEK